MKPRLLKIEASSINQIGMFGMFEPSTQYISECRGRLGNPRCHGAGREFRLAGRFEGSGHIACV
jgi:hypothetical protein